MANIPRIGVIRDPSTWVQDLAGSRAYEDPPEIDYYNHEHLVSTDWMVDTLRSRICPRGEPWTGPKDSTDKWYFDHGHTDCYEKGFLALRLEQLQARVDAAGNPMRLAAALAMLATTFTHAPTASAGSGCGTYHGRDYVVCVESGPNWMPNGRPSGNQHPGRSTASGPCGMLAATRRKFHGDSLAACGRYMAVRYGSWARAEAHHRTHGWW